MIKINKLLGFYELMSLGLPCVPWVKFEDGMKLDSQLLWTVRTAVLRGDDFNLPRIVGVTADEAYEFALKQKQTLRENGMVVLYPYFIAEKSGTLEVSQNKAVIEGVEKDLWNLVTYNKRDVTHIIIDMEVTSHGNEFFFDKEELDILKAQINIVRGKFREIIAEGKSILLEWSFAYNTDTKKQKIGDKYLVFYEVREI